MADPNSFANLDALKVGDSGACFFHQTVLEAALFLQVSSFHLELDVDFERKVLKGHVDIKAEAQKSDPKLLVLDTRDLLIEKVRHQLKRVGVLIFLPDSRC